MKITSSTADLLGCKEFGAVCALWRWHFYFGALFWQWPISEGKERELDVQCNSAKCNTCAGDSVIRFLGDNEASIAATVCLEEPFANCADGDDAPNVE